ncbi:MAG: ABC transporter substrate-binding protein, partial [Armatimonadetes bacterium]|nr:ABC transporter substrate-binding protein [Armatimonadota bacterium]
IKIGDFNLNFEKIIELNPDLIVAEGTILKEALEKFKKLKIPILILNSKNLNNFEKSFLMLSRTVGKEALGKKLLKIFNLQIKKIKNKTKEIKNKPKIFLEIWNKPLQTCSKGTLTDELINLAGGINIAQDLKIHYPVISEEFLVTQNPQIIILTTSKINEIYQKKSWKNILALKNKKVYYLNPDLIARPTLRLILALNKLTSFFNPQIKL